MVISGMARVSLGFALVGCLCVAGCSGSSSPPDAGAGDTGAGDAGAGDTGAGDAGAGDTGVFCPLTAPPPSTQTGACCYRASNAARLGHPSFRVASFKLSAPSGTLSSNAALSLVQPGIDEEKYNLLLQIIDAPVTDSSPVTVRMDWGVRHSDGTFSFLDDKPEVLTGTVDGEDLTTLPFPHPLTVATADPTGATNTTIPVVAFSFLHMPMTENRSCVGLRTTRWNDEAGGSMSGFILVASAKTLRFSVATLDTTLCNVIAGDPLAGPICDMPQSMWTTQPDSLCTGTTTVTCTLNTTGMTDVCDPATAEGSTGAGGKPGCNAWHLLGQFVAQGVDII